MTEFLTDIFFESKYYKIFEENSEGKYCQFKFTQGSKKASYPFLINSVNDLGFDLSGKYFDIQGAYGYNGVIANSYDTSFITGFYEAFNEYCLQKNIIAEFTRFHPLLENHIFSKNHLNVIFDRQTIAVNLDQTYDEIWLNQYSSNNRNMIRKAQRLGYSLRVLKTPTPSDINIFIDIYKYTMEKAGAEKYYYFTDVFFQNIFKLLNKYALLFNIYNTENQLVSSTIFFHYGEYFHYYLSGKTADADNSINNFLLDEAIKFAKSKGAKTIHLGGGRSSDSKDSLLKFKSNFSKTRLPFYIGKKIHNQEVYDEVIQQWELKFPQKREKFKNHILKYRY